MQAHGYGARGIRFADHDRHVLRETVLVAEHGDLALERVGQRHARAAEELQCVMAEPRCLMHDVADRNAEHAGGFAAVGREADQGRNESAGFGQLQRSGRQSGARRRCVDVERSAIHRAFAVDARDGLQVSDVGAPRNGHSHRPAELMRKAGSKRALGSHEQKGPAGGGGREPRELWLLDGLHRGYEQTVARRRDLDGTTAAQLVNGAIEGQRGRIAIDCRGFDGGHSQEGARYLNVRIPA